MSLIDDEIWKFGSKYGLPNTYGKTLKRGNTSPAQPSATSENKDNRNCRQRPKSQGHFCYGAENSEFDLIDIIGRLRSERRPLQDISNKRHNDLNKEEKKKLDYLDLRLILRSQSLDTVSLGGTPEDQGEDTAEKLLQPGASMHNIASQMSSISLDERNSIHSLPAYGDEVVACLQGLLESESEAPDSHDDDTMSVIDSHTLNTSLLPLNSEHQDNMKVHTFDQATLSQQKAPHKSDKSLKNLCDKTREKVILDMTKELDELISSSENIEKEQMSSLYQSKKPDYMKGYNLKASCAGATSIRNKLKKRGSSLAEICDKTNTSKAPPRVGLSKRAKLEPLHDYLQKKNSVAYI